MTAPPALVDDLTADRLGVALGQPIAGVEATQVGTGQIGTCYRLRLEGDLGGLPRTVLAKLPATDEATRTMLAGAYASEVRFYAQIAPTVDVRVPRCFHAEGPDDEGRFVLLLEDLAPARQGDQIAGCTPAQVRDAAQNLAGLHGPRWSDPSLLEIDGLTLNGPEDAATLAELFGPTVDLFLEGLGPLIDAEDAATLRTCVEVAESWALGGADAARRERFGLVHGDYRLDNLLFPPDGGPGVTAVDWQTISLALPARDLAYLIGTSLEPEDRRQHERDLVAAYHSHLTSYDGPAVAPADYDLDACWEDYRFAMLQVPLVSVFGCAYGTRSDRGDAMFAAMVRRGCAAIRDLGTLEVASA